MNSLKLLHLGIINRSEQEAETFYDKLLGLKKLYDFEIEADLSARLFSYPEQLKVLVYGSDSIKIEIIILEDFSLTSPSVQHTCIQVDNLERFIKNAAGLNAEIISAERNGKILYFVKDFSGNLFEIK